MKTQIQIEYNPREGAYYFGVIQGNKVFWNSKYFKTTDEAKEKIYELYPDAVISLKE